MIHVREGREIGAAIQMVIGQFQPQPLGHAIADAITAIVVAVAPKTCGSIEGGPFRITVANVIPAAEKRPAPPRRIFHSEPEPVLPVEINILKSGLDRLAGRL